MKNLIDTNSYSDAFTEFQESKLYNSIINEFTPQPYYKQFRALFYTALVASIIFQFFSGLTASTLVYFFINGMINAPILAAIITVAFLLTLEISKRQTSGEVFRNYLQYKKLSQRFSKGLIMVVVCLSALSISFSYFGSKKLVQAFTPPPMMMNADSLTAQLKQDIADIDGQIKTANNQTNSKGKVLYNVLPTITSLNQQKATIQNRIFEIDNRTNGKNDKIEVTHDRDTKYKAEYFALFTLLLELAFLGCAYYVKYFKYRSLVEMLSVNPANIETVTPQPVEPSNEPTPEPKPVEPPAVELASEPTAQPSPNGMDIKGDTTRTVIKGFLSNDNRINDNRIKTKNNIKNRICEYCQTGYVYRHHKQKYCCDDCRIKAWEKRTGRKFGKKKTVKTGV